jgi:hypothetical protein
VTEDCPPRELAVDTLLFLDSTLDMFDTIEFVLTEIGGEEE